MATLSVTAGFSGWPSTRPTGTITNREPGRRDSTSLMIACAESGTGDQRGLSCVHVLRARWRSERPLMRARAAREVAKHELRRHDGRRCEVLSPHLRLAVPLLHSCCHRHSSSRARNSLKFVKLRLCICCETHNAHALRTPKHGGRNRNGRRRGRHSLLLHRPLIGGGLVDAAPSQVRVSDGRTPHAVTASCVTCRAHLLRSRSPCSGSLT